MKKTIYAICRIHGNQDHKATKTKFNGKADLFRYVDKVNSRECGGSRRVASSMNINELLAALYDCGPGIGSRSWARLSAREFAKNEAREV